MTATKQVFWSKDIYFQGNASFNFFFFLITIDFYDIRNILYLLMKFCRHSTLHFVLYLFNLGICGRRSRTCKECTRTWS